LNNCVIELLIPNYARDIAGERLIFRANAV